jgi:hypothetical protein
MKPAPYTGPKPTLEQLQASIGWVWARCAFPYTHSAAIPLARVIQRTGPSSGASAFRKQLRCTICGKRRGRDSGLRLWSTAGSRPWQLILCRLRCAKPRARLTWRPVAVRPACNRTLDGMEPRWHVAARRELSDRPDECERHHGGGDGRKHDPHLQGRGLLEGCCAAGIVRAHGELKRFTGHLRSVPGGAAPRVSGGLRPFV